MGRNSDYNPDTFPTLAEGYARRGLVDKAIAKKLGISCSTFYSYCLIYPEFSEAVRRGKMPVDFEVESALLKRARGYNYKETTTEILKGKDGEVFMEKTKTVIKELAPDVGAAMNWLKNRDPKNWKDKNFQQVQKVDADGEPVDEQEFKLVIVSSGVPIATSEEEVK